MLWLNTCGPASSTRATASRSPWKSGVSTSTRASGSARPTSRTVSREMVRPAVRKVVAVHAGDHHVAQLHRRRHARHVGGLRRIEPHVRLPGIALRHRTEAAAARAEIAQDHERRRAAMEALVDVGQRADSQTVWRFKLPQARASAVFSDSKCVGALARPFRQTRRRRGNLNEAGGHERFSIARRSVSKPAARSFCLES